MAINIPFLIAFAKHNVQFEIENKKVTPKPLIRLVFCLQKRAAMPIIV
jgi:hypothetical protein